MTGNLFRLVSVAAVADPEPGSKIILLRLCVPLILYYGTKKIDQWVDK